MSRALVLISHYNSKDGVSLESKPLVLCKECKWWIDNGASCTHWLPCQEASTPELWFCASGEERDNDEKAN